MVDVCKKRWNHFLSTYEFEKSEETCDVLMSSINYERASSRIERPTKETTDQNKHVEHIGFVCRHGSGRIGGDKTDIGN